jgi:hypothetical protein
VRILLAVLALLVWALTASPRSGGRLVAAGPDTPPAARSNELGAPGPNADIVVTGLPRPIQLSLDARGALVVLSHGWRGDAAAELYRLDLNAAFPIDASRAPRVVIPFSEEPRKTVFGSLALEPGSGHPILGEENGNRIYRLGAGQRLETLVVGLNHLLGGSALAVDALGRLVFLDYASPETHLRSETPLPPSLTWLTEESYRGPLVFRIDTREARPLPRRADLLSAILPRAGVPPAGREPLWRLIGVVPAGDDLVLLSSIGEVFRLAPGGELRQVAKLPPGHYHRINLATGPDGSIFVSSGFHIRQVFRVSPSGRVSVVASELGDPGGLVVDASGAIYVAETALHRIIRIPGGR